MDNTKNENKKYISTMEAAELMGISRQAVFKQIKEGKIKAQKVGRNFVIDKNELANSIGGEPLSEETKKEIDKVVRKAVEEYEETFKLLGKE